MINALLCLLCVIILGFAIIIPVYVKVFKEFIWEYIKTRMKEEKEAEKLKKRMIQNKKGR